MPEDTWPKPDMYDGRTKIERAIIEFIDEYPATPASEVAEEVGCHPIKVRDLIRELVRNRQATVVGGVGNGQCAILITGNATSGGIRDYLHKYPEASELDIAEGLSAGSAEVAHVIRHMITAGSLYEHDDPWLGLRYFTKQQVYAMVGYARTSRVIRNAS